MTIDFGRAFAFLAEDPRWLPKLGLIGIFSVLAVILILFPLGLVGLAAVPDEIIQELAPLYPEAVNMRPVLPASSLALLALPFVMGLVLLALLLGYYIELVRQVRRGAHLPLPAWTAWETKLIDGLLMELAYAGYLASNGVLFAVGLALIRQIGGMNAQLVRLTLAMCCLIPLVALYGMVIVFMTSICVLPYSASGRFMDFYRWGWVWRRLREDTRLTLTWFGYGVAANLGFGAAGALPVIGVLANLLSLFLSVPVQGHLLGQYAAALDDRHGDGVQV
jgi:hypothetical protein